MSYPVNYTPAIKSVLQNLSLNLTIKNKSTVFLNQILNKVNGNLISACHSKYQQDEHSQSSDNPASIALNAVEEIFPGELKHNAKAEGNRNIMLYKNGLLNYSPRNSISASSIFNAGIHNVGSSFFPDAKIHQNAVLIINEFLDNFSEKICEKAAESGSSKNKIEVIDFEKALISFLPQEMLRHANKEGDKKVSALESHLFSFVPGVSNGTFTNTIRSKPKIVPKKRKATSSTAIKASATKKKRKVSKTAATLQSKPINYSPGIKHIAKDLGNAEHLSKPAVTFLNNIVNELNYKLIDYCITNTENLPANSTISFEVAEDAVSAAYPGELLTHAKTEAQKDMYMLQNDMLKYKPRKRKLKAGPGKVTQRTVFTNGFSKLINNTVPGAKLDKTSRLLMTNLLESLFTKLCRETRILMKNQNMLMHDDISFILKDVLPDEMCHFAEAEAAKALLKYNMGTISFTPQVTKSRKK